MEIQVSIINKILSQTFLGPNNSPLDFLVIRGKDSQDENKIIFDALKLLENSINKKVNYPIKWQRLETKRASRIRIDLDGGYKSSEEDWTAFHEIMIDAMNQLEAAIKPELKKLKI